MPELIYGAKPQERIDGYLAVELSLKHVYVWNGTRDEPVEGQGVARFRDREWRLADGVPFGTKTTTQLVVAQPEGDYSELEAWSGDRPLGSAPVFVLEAHEQAIHLKGAQGLGGSRKPWGVTDTVAWCDASGNWHSHSGELEAPIEVAASGFFRLWPVDVLPDLVLPGVLLRPSALAECRLRIA